MAETPAELVEVAAQTDSFVAGADNTPEESPAEGIIAADNFAEPSAVGEGRTATAGN